MRLTILWIWLCAYLNCAGWTLAWLHQLNAIGYAVVLGLGLAAGLIWRGKTSPPRLPKIHRQKYLRRFRRPLPLAFLVLAALALLGGVIYAPTNYDALTYRLPRMLNWLAAGQWFWIPTSNPRMNYSTTVWEWTAMPQLALFRSDRGLFLINAISFLLLPGLIFSVFRQAGIARRTAWMWMWLLPLAYGYATQAGGLGNDLLGAVFALAAVHFGLRARRSQDVKDIWLALLAAALMTGVKLSNLPLLLPCLVAVWPALIHLRQRLVATTIVAVIAVLVSGAPIMALNQTHTGSWTGDPDNSGQMQVKNPAAAFFGNSILLGQQSFMPPVLPAAHQLDDRFNKTMPAACRQILVEKFPRYQLNRLNELPQEETAGLGLGVTLLLLATMVAGIGGVIWKKSSPKITLVGFAAWVSVLFYMTHMGSEATARLLLPYYPLAIIPILLLPLTARIFNSRTWKIFGLLAAWSVLPVVILSPSRPLWPALSLSEWLVRHHPNNLLAQRTTAVYSAYAHRNDPLAPLRDGLPKGFLKIGLLAGGNDTDYSLWRPFGFRKIEYLQIGPDQSIKLPADLEWLVIKRVTWDKSTRVPLETWATEHHAQITRSVPIVTLVSWGEQTWCLLHIEKP